MKAAESLFEFMPYGAPELLQSRRERLASALLLSSLTIAVAFVAVGGLVRLIVAPEVVIPPVFYAPRFIDPQPNWTLPRPPTPVPAVHARAPNIDGVPVPAAEPDVPLVKDTGPAWDNGAAQKEGTGPATDDAIAPPGEEALPPPDTHVWAEQYPEPVTQVTPPYPAIAREAGVEGLVIVKVLVGKTGRVLDERLDEKRQVPLLNESALEAARQWVFTPALANGRPVAVWTAIPFNYRLH
jgi:TonB family protein